MLENYSLCFIHLVTNVLDQDIGMLPLLSIISHNAKYCFFVVLLTHHFSV